MKYINKTAAFAMSLLLCMGAYAPAVSFAEEPEGLYAIEDETEAVESETKTSGSFTYSLTTEGNACIEDCSDTSAELVIPDEIDGKKVTELGAGAFGESPAETITIPSSVEYIYAENPFARCAELKEIKIDGESDYYTLKDGVLFTKDMSKLVMYPPKKQGTSYTVPEGVLNLGVAAFYNNASLTEIKLPSSAEEMGHHTFAGCSALKSIDMSGTKISFIEDLAFFECTSLSEVKFYENCLSIGLGSFYMCKALTEIELPQHLIDIGQSAFMATGLKEITVPSSVESIGYSALGYDDNENAVSGFVVIGDENSAAQKYCTDADEEYDYKNNFEFVSTQYAEARKEYLSLDTKLSGDYEYMIEDGKATLVFCSSTAYDVNVPSEIDGYELTKIYKGAFLTCDCSEITLPETVTTIGDTAFKETLIVLNLPASCTTIEGEEPFIYCSGLEEINVAAGNTAYSSENGVLYNADKSELIAYPMAKWQTDFTAPKTVRKIGKSAFCNNPYLESADISTVTNIGTYAFEGCTSLSNVKFSKDLVAVGADAFYDCPSLKSIRLYNKLETLGECAFGYCFDEEAAAEIQEKQAEKAQQSALDTLLGEEEEDLPSTDRLVDGFKIYADENTLGYNYAEANNIETVTNTIPIGSKNVAKGFLYGIAGLAAAALMAVIGFITGKSISRKKAQKKHDELVKATNEKIKKKREEAEEVKKNEAE